MRELFRRRWSSIVFLRRQILETHPCPHSDGLRASECGADTPDAEALDRALAHSGWLIPQVSFERVAHLRSPIGRQGAKRRAASAATMSS